MDENSRVVVERGPFEMIPHWLLYEPSVNALAIRLYLVLRRHADAEGECYPSRQRLAGLLAVSLPTLDRSREQLVNVGAICVQRRNALNNAYTSSLYHVHWERKETCVGYVKNVDKGSKESFTLTNTQLTNTQSSKELVLAEQKHAAGTEVAAVASTSRRGKRAGRRIYTHEFEAFWVAYPRRVAKQTAFEAWKKALVDTSVDEIMQGVARYANDPNREQQYTAHPATWLNAGRWEDEELPARAKKTGNTGGEKRMDNYEALYTRLSVNNVRGEIEA